MLVVIGWLAITLVALYFTVLSFIGFWAISHFGNHKDTVYSTIGLVLLSALLWYFSYDNFPFTLTVRS